MKKLFTIGSSIVIDAFSELRITGAYELLALKSNAAIIQSGSYRIEVAGEDLIVEKLAEELAVFTFHPMESLQITEHAVDETVYGA